MKNVSVFFIICTISYIKANFPFASLCIVWYVNIYIEIITEQLLVSYSPFDWYFFNWNIGVFVFYETTWGYVLSIFLNLLSDKVRSFEVKMKISLLLSFLALFRLSSLQYINEMLCLTFLEVMISSVTYWLLQLKFIHNNKNSYEKDFFWYPYFIHVVPFFIYIY